MDTFKGNKTRDISESYELTKSKLWFKCESVICKTQKISTISDKNINGTFVIPIPSYDDKKNTPFSIFGF